MQQFAQNARCQLESFFKKKNFCFWFIPLLLRLRFWLKSLRRYVYNRNLSLAYAKTNRLDKVIDTEKAFRSTNEGQMLLGDITLIG